MLAAMRWWLVALCACGRVNFDPLGGGSSGDGGGSAGDGGGSAGDGSVQSGDGDLCQTATVIDIDQLLPTDLATAADDYPGSICGNGIDIVFRIDIPNAGNYTVSLTTQFGGVESVSAMCPPPVQGSCHGFGATQTDNNTVPFATGANYIVIDRTMGTGTGLTITVH